MTDEFNLKTPPHSLEAEQSLLGGLMLDNQRWDSIVEKVSTADFYRPEHRAIFTAMVGQIEAQQPIDVITLTEELERAGELEDAGGVLYLTELVENASGIGHLDAYADIVRERALLRRLIDVAQTIAAGAYEPEGRTAEELVDEAERAVFQIAEDRPSESGPVMVKDILKTTLKRIDELSHSDSPITGLSTGFEKLDHMTTGLQPGDLIIVAARPSMGKCIVAGSRILDPDTGRRVPIEELVEQRAGRLLTLNDAFQLTPSAPSAYVDDGLKPVYRVVTGLGREIQTTLSHPFLTGAGWLPLSQISVGERIGVPRELPVFGTLEWPPERVKLLAYLIADGGVTESNARFTNSNSQLLDEFRNCVSAFGGVHCTDITSDGRTPSVRVKSDEAYIVAARQEFAAKLADQMQQQAMTGRDLAGLLQVAPSTISYWLQGKNLPTYEAFATLAKVLRIEESELLAGGYGGAGRNNVNHVTLWLEQLGLAGKSALDKFVPEPVFQFQKPLIALFLNRLFACDGSLYVQNETQSVLSYATSSPTLASDVQHLLLRFGILARRREKSMTYKDARRPAYELVISHQQSLRTFIQEIGIFGKEQAVARAAQLLDERREHSNTDSLPDSVGDYILAAKGERSWSALYAAKGLSCPEGYNAHLASGQSQRRVSRTKAKHFAELLDDHYLAALASSDLYWDEIVRIEALGEQQVYDLTVPETHNFVADDVLVHNTTFAMNLVESALMFSDKPVIVFSLEMPGEQLIQRMLSSLGRINQTKVRTGKLEADDWDKLTNAVNKLHDRPLFIDDTAGISPSEMRARTRRLAREYGEPGLIMVDYLQLMKIKGFTEGRTNEISEISRSLKAIAKEFKCPVVALSQLNRSLEQRPNKRPVNSDLRESGAIEQDADVIAFIYRDVVYNPDTSEPNVAEIIIGKQRNGPIGTCHLAFIGEHTRFENLSYDYQGQDE